MADNPKVEGFNVACYHKDLEPFMARGRELTAQGITDDKERDGTRWKEMDDREAGMPREARTLTVMTGKAFDAATGGDRRLHALGAVRAVRHGRVHRAADEAGAGVPWLMDPGTAGAHIMISPPRPAAPRP